MSLPGIMLTCKLFIFVFGLFNCLDLCQARLVDAETVLSGEWVRYRSEFREFAVGFNQRNPETWDATPSAIFYPNNDKDVQWFAETFREKFAFSVRSGGHSYERLSATPCSLVVDTSELNDVDVDWDDIDYVNNLATVKVGGGVRHAELYESLAKKELAIAGAKCLDVGFTGCTLGGCHGYFSAAFGLSSDNVKSFDLVMANSSLISVTADDDPDLFWALRGGGGGDFGVVTAMTVEARLLRGVVTYKVEFDMRNEELELVEALVDLWQQWALTELPNGTTAFLKCSAAFECEATGMHPGNDDTLIARSLRRLTSSLVPMVFEENEPEADVRVEQHLTALRRFSDCKAEEKASYKVKSLYFDARIPPKVLEQGIRVLHSGNEMPGGVWNGIEFQRVGFLPARDASAADLFHRNKFLVELTSSWSPWAGAAVDKAHLDWVHALHAALAPTGTGFYRNAEDLDMGATLYTQATWQTHPASFYYAGDGVLKLAAVKEAMDGDDVFKHALSSSFEAAANEDFKQHCRGSSWPAYPEKADEPALALAMVSQYAADWVFYLREGQLAASAQQATHMLYSWVQPLMGGWVNISVSSDQGQKILDWAKVVRDANPHVKRILSIGGPKANETIGLWFDMLGSAGQRQTFGWSINVALDELGLEGVDIDWNPRSWQRTNFTELVRAVREHIGPDRLLCVHADIEHAAVEAEGAYDAKNLTAIADMVFLRTLNFEPLSPDTHLQWLTHHSAGLFSANPSLPSGAAGVANWLAAGATRSKLLLTVPTHGTGYDTAGPPPDSWGHLDWRVRCKTAALTHLSETPGEASWAELHEALFSDWSSWEWADITSAGGAAAWNYELGVWIGFDSPGTVRQKAKWIRDMGLGGALLGPLHYDAFGEGKESLGAALLGGLGIVLELEEGETFWTAMMISIVAGVPTVLLCCCVDAQLRRWGDIRKMHDGLTHVSNTTESWSHKVRSTANKAPHVDPSAAVEEGNGGPHGVSNEVVPLSPNGRDRAFPGSPMGRPAFRRTSITSGNIFSFARRFSTTSNVVPFRAASSTGNLHRTASVQEVHSAFDGAMQQGHGTQFDEIMWAHAGTGALSIEEIRALKTKDLSRRLALLKRADPMEGQGRPDYLGVGKDDGYEGQRGVVRYSRLLLRDAVDWLENSDNDYMAFYKSKQRGVIKLTCVITMYAETPDLLERSLRGIAHGIHQLATETAFLRSWDEAVVIIVQDGLSKLEPETALWLEQMGVYSRSLVDDAAKLDEALEGQKVDVALHCFEGLMQFEDWSPTQTMLVIKQENAGKLDSQRWAFTGLIERLMPVMPVGLRTAALNDEKKHDKLADLTFNDLRALDRYLVTVDAGTQPMTNSLRELLLPMRYDPTIAGTCGHMIPDKTIGNVMVMSQVFEYEHGHIIDKSMESMFGFITVLPGAYSAFRYDAIRRDQWIRGCYRREGPLVDYFKPLATAIDSPALLNMGLAEDRFLCFSLMTMKNKDYSLWYCRRAKAVTDVPDTLQGFLQQRRRWNNGAFFTRLFTIRHYAEMFQSTNHGIIKKVGFIIQLITMITDSVFVWFAAAFFYLWITYNVQRLGQGVANAMGPCFLVIYLLAVVAHYDRRVREVRWVHRLIALLLALEVCFCLGAFVYDQIKEPNYALIALVCFSFAVMFFCALLQHKFIKVLGVLPAYLLMYPTYAILTQLYGFCHVHDVSWGTKGIETANLGGDQQEKALMVQMALSSFRFRILVAFIISNFVFGYIIGFVNEEFNILLYLLLVLVGMNCIRYIGSLAFTMVNWFDDALQLTALKSASGRDFGDEYKQMKEHVQRINLGDIRTARDTYVEFRRRTILEQQKRREERKRVLEQEPARVELEGHYFENESQSGGSTAASRTNSVPFGNAFHAPPPGRLPAVQPKNPLPPPHQGNYGAVVTHRNLPGAPAPALAEEAAEQSQPVAEPQAPKHPPNMTLPGEATSPMRVEPATEEVPSLYSALGGGKPSGEVPNLYSALGGGKPSPVKEGSESTTPEEGAARVKPLSHYFYTHVAQGGQEDPAAKTNNQSE